MKVIVVSKYHGRTRNYNISGWTKLVLSVCLIGIPMGLGMWIGQTLENSDDPDLFVAASAHAWDETLQSQAQELAQTKRQAHEQLTALTLRVAELQSRLVRLDALGERLTVAAKFDRGEFQFGEPPAVGGPESDALGEAYQPPEFLQVLDALSAQIADRQQQLETLEALLANLKVQENFFVAGRPVKSGWISSRYGRRTDPFKGHVAWHSGVDFAGKSGSDIVSVAAGVVTWADDKTGYGRMVEINHGNGFSTRYAHNQNNLVKVGDVVKKGQVIALMGSTGRSTGPHVHFEVYKNGRAVDPSSYVHRTIR